MDAEKNKHKNWHRKHTEGLTFGQKVSDKFAMGMGSWPFIIFQTVFVAIWITINLIGFLRHWDPYPFILLNLLFSTQAAYAAPIIMMSQNRQNERDRLHAEQDFHTNIRAEKEIENVHKILTRLEKEKLEKIIEIISKNQQPKL